MVIVGERNHPISFILFSFFFFFFFLLCFLGGKLWMLKVYLMELAKTSKSVVVNKMTVELEDFVYHKHRLSSSWRTAYVEMW